jgi:hypothetical protein
LRRFELAACGRETNAAKAPESHLWAVPRLIKERSR